jgi:hypothetical protein
MYGTAAVIALTVKVQYRNTAWHVWHVWDAMPQLQTLPNMMAHTMRLLCTITRLNHRDSGLDRSCIQRGST